MTDAGTGDALAKVERLLEEGKWPEAVKAAGKVIEKLEDRGNRAGLARVLTMRAKALIRIPQYKKAATDLVKALAIHKEIGDKGMEADTLSDLGYIHWQMADHYMALEFYDEAIRLARGLDDKILEGRCTIEIGNVLNYEGRLENAIVTYRKAINLLNASDAPPPREMSRAYNNIGNTLKQLERILEAASCLKKAIHFAEMDGNISGSAWARQNLAECYIITGNLAVARDFLQKGLEQFREVGEIIGEVNILVSYGRLYRAEGKYEMSMQSFEDAERLARETDAVSIMDIIIKGRAETLEAMGDVPGAIEAYRKAAALFKEVGHTADARECEEAVKRLSGQ